MLDQIKEIVTIEKSLVECSPRGNCRAVKTNKPKNGIYAYVWRMVRFYSGEDTCLPMTASFDLHNGIENVFGVKYYTDQKDSNGISVKGYNSREVEAYLDDVAKQVVENLGMGPLRLVVNADDTLTVTGKQNSLDYIAVSGIVDKVNKMDALTLAIVYFGSQKAGYSASTAWDIIASGIDKEKLLEVKASELRKLIVKQNGGSINGSVDHWIDESKKRLTKVA